MARRPIARAPAAPAGTSTTRATSPSAIGIPHYVLDYESRFRESVIDNFADSYAAGRDAGALHRVQPLGQVPRPAGDRARPRRVRARHRPLRRLAPSCATARARCVCAADADRDQSYFLFATTREQLDYLRFPLGDMTKPEVRELARRFGLEVADKQDSQDICFVPTGRYTDIIGRLRPNAMEPGDIVDLDGRVLGRHARHRQFHRRPAQGPRHRRRRAAVRGAARCGEPPRRGRPARGAADGPHRAARRQLDRRRRARPR